MSESAVRLLYIEDDEGLAELLKRRMERQGYSVEIAHTGQKGLDAFRGGSFGAVLLDYRLPDMDALTVLHRMEAETSPTPIIILTALGDEKIAVEAMHSGASDYIVKDVNQRYLELLPIVLRSAITKGELLEKTRLQQEALRESEERFRTIVQQVKDYAIFAMGIDRRPISWNIGVREVLGFDEAEFLGRDIVPLIFTPEDLESGVVEKEFHAAARDGSASNDRWMRRKDGYRFWASGVTSSLKDSQGKLVGFIKIMRDYSDQRRFEEALSTALEQANAASIAKSEFLANMSHEIRTPMNAVVGLTDILSHTRPLSAKQSEYIDTLRLSSKSLMELINDLLDISKIENSAIELERVPFTFESVLSDLTGIFLLKAQQKGLELRVEDSALLHQSFSGDTLRIKQIITNLISNAVKFTEKGGIIMRVDESSYPFISGASFGVALSIEDTGIGIPAAKLEQIFDKFTQADASTTRKYGGTGLGLAISKNLAQIMGGMLEVTSREGEGSKFLLHLPLEAAYVDTASPRETALATQEAQEETPLQADGPWILLVEDYLANILVATTLLADLNYRCDVAKDGNEALAMLRQFRERYAVVLMDVQMPGIDGFEVTGIIRAEEREKNLEPLRIVAMTAHALSGDRERCINAGMDDYISKPFNPAELKRILEKFSA